MVPPPPWSKAKWSTFILGWHWGWPFPFDGTINLHKPMFSMSQPIFFAFSRLKRPWIPGPFERPIETCGWAPSAPSLRVDTGCATVGAAAGGANYKTHPKMLKNAVKMMTNQWNVANLHNQIPNGFPILKGFAPPTAPLQGGDRFFPLSVPDGARRGEKGRWRSAFPHSSAARQTKQPETRPAAEGPSVAAHFPSSISARSTSSCGDGRNHQIKNHATIFGASKSIGGQIPTLGQSPILDGSLPIFNASEFSIHGES